MTIKPSNFHRAAVIAGIICERLGYATGASAGPRPEFNQLCQGVMDLLSASPSQQMWEEKAATTARFVERTSLDRLKEFAANLLAGNAEGVRNRRTAYVKANNVPARNIRSARLAAAAEAGARAKGLPIVRVAGELGYEIGSTGEWGWVRVSLFGYTGRDGVVRVRDTEVLRNQ